MPDTDISLQDAADLLGVHYMTAYRYVRLGLLPAHKDGSAWRVAVADVEAFRAEPEVGSPRRRAPWAERFEARLLAGDSRGAWGVVEAALAAGTELDGVYLDIVSPAMTSIGARWARGEIDVAEEHRASGIAMRIVGRLGPRFVRRGRTRGGVVLGAPAGEHHALPVALLSDLLRGAGFEVSDLGADVPAASLARAARDTPRLVAVGVSVTNTDLLGSAAESLRAVRAAVGPNVPLFVGGLAVAGAEEAAALGADGWAPDGRSAVELLEGMLSRRPTPLSPADAG